MQLFVVRKMPDPRDESYSAALAEWVGRFVADTDGRAFVLFTSYRAMQQLAEEMESFFVRQKMNLLVQGKGAPRSQLLEQFKNYPSQRPLRDRQFLDGSRCSRGSALECHHYPPAFCRARSSPD